MIVAEGRTKARCVGPPKQEAAEVHSAINEQVEHTDYGGNVIEIAHEAGQGREEVRGPYRCLRVSLLLHHSPIHGFVTGGPEEPKRRDGIVDGDGCEKLGGAREALQGCPNARRDDAKLDSYL